MKQENITSGLRVSLDFWVNIAYIPTYSIAVFWIWQHLNFLFLKVIA